MSTVVETPGRIEELVRSTMAGSPDALAELYRRHADLVYGVAFRLLANAADAEDVLQDVFVGLPEALARFETGRPLEPWLKRVAARAALSRVRSERRRAHRAEDAVRIQALRGGHAASTLDLLILRHALDELPASLRSVLLLREVEGFSHQEIGEMLGISEGSSATRLHRAWSRLRQQMEG